MIKQIYFINLDSRLIKKKFIEHQLNKTKIPYKRIPGIICNNYDDYPIVERIQHGSELHKGTLGCFLAHQYCLEQILKDHPESDKDDLYCILEDDVHIYNFSIFTNIVDVIIKFSAYDVYFVNAANRRQRPNAPLAYKLQDNVYRIPKGGYIMTYPYFLGAFFYVLKFQTIKKILNIIQNINVYDDYDAFLYANLDCCTLVTKKVDLKDFESDRDPECNIRSKRIKG